MSSGPKPPRWRGSSQLVVALLAVVAWLTMPLPAHAQGARVALLPAQGTVAPGSEFELTLEVTQAGSAFNAFSAVIGYNPAALTFLPLAPTSLQQGCLMTGACSAACGNTFPNFSARNDSLILSSSLLCNQVTLTGPGQIYRLRFRASNTLQITDLTILQVSFYDAGIYVTPVLSTGCRVGIGVTLGVGEDAPLPNGLRLTAEPNPAFSRVALLFAAEASGDPEIVVTDVLGRTVRRFTQVHAERGIHRIEWDGRNDAGERLPAGVYLVRLRLGEQTRQTRVTLLR